MRYFLAFIFVLTLMVLGCHDPCWPHSPGYDHPTPEHKQDDQK